MERLFSETMIKSDRFIRYYDDIEYGCESKSEAHKVLTIFEDALRNFELEINPEKVEMLSGPSAIESAWLYRLRDIQNKEGIKANEITEIFSFIAEIANQYPNDHVFRYFLRKMRTSIVHESAWNAYQRILLSLLQENRGNAREVFDQLGYYKAIGWKMNRKAMKEALDRKILNQLNRGATSELSWAVYGYIKFNINMNKKLVDMILSRGDCPSKVLVTKIIFDRGISLKTNINSIIRTWGDDILNSSEWLLAYESLVNKWHGRNVSIRLPRNNELIEHLRDNKTSFIDFDAMGRLSLPQIFKQRIGTDEQDIESDWEDIFGAEDDEVEDDDSGFRVPYFY